MTDDPSKRDKSDTATVQPTMDLNASGSNKVLAEPRAMTLADILAIIAGFAVAFVMAPFLSRGSLAIVLSAKSLWFLITVAITELTVIFVVAMAIVIFSRRMRYARMPRSGEWMVMLVALWAITLRIPNVDEVVNQAYQIWGELDDFGWWRWRVAGASCMFAMILALLLHATRKQLPIIVKIALLCLIAAALLWGPLPVIALQLDYIHPSIMQYGDGWQRSLAILLGRVIAKLPLALMLTLPATAAVYAMMRGTPRDWLWYEWLGASSVLVLAISLLALNFLGNLAAKAKLEEWIDVLVWIVAFGICSGLLLVVGRIRTVNVHSP